MSATAHPTTSVLVTRACGGALAGIVGGVVFGMLMATMGMLPMVGGLIGRQRRRRLPGNGRGAGSGKREAGDDDSSGAVGS